MRRTWNAIYKLNPDLFFIPGFITHTLMLYGGYVWYYLLWNEEIPSSYEVVDMLAAAVLITTLVAVMYDIFELYEGVRKDPPDEKTIFARSHFMASLFMVPLVFFTPLKTPAWNRSAKRSG